jgi:AraC-like DNA-binding protein
VEGLAGSDQARFRFFRVRPPLDRYVSYLYTSELPSSFAHRVVGVRLPELEMQLVFSIEEGLAFPGARYFVQGLGASLFVQPAHLRTISIPGTIREAVGASLQPAGLRLLFERGAGDLSDAPLIPLEDLWGEPARALRDKLLEANGPLERVALLAAELSERARRASRPHVSAQRAIEKLTATDGEIPIGRLASHCGVTDRTLRSVLLSETGLSPKHIARIARIRRALKFLQETPVGSPRSDGYCEAFSDAAHACREFRWLLSTTPAALRRELAQTNERVPSFSSERNLVDTGLLVLGLR